MSINISNNPKHQLNFKQNVGSKCQNELKRTLQPEENIDNIRKIRHINQQEFQYDQDSFKEQSITQPISKQKNKKTSTEITSITNQSLREKYSHLLPDYMSVTLSLEHQTLLKAQSKLDQHLQFLKGNRGKRKGQFFEKIRHNLIEGAHFFISINQIKQILFLCPQFYTCSWQQNQEHKFDFFISKISAQSIEIRTNMLRKTLYEYLKSNGEYERKSQKKICIVIPQRKFQFQQKAQQCKNKISSNKKQIAKKEIYQPQDDRASLMESAKGGSQSFKQKLYQILKKKQQKMKATHQLQRQSQIIKYTKKQYITILDGIHLIYLSKNVSNMFKVSLIDMLDKRINLTSTTISKIIQQLIPIVGQIGYLKTIEHKEGLILQIDKKKLGQARKKLETIQIN